jgi:SNF2 family DNA or RNA helicase
MYKQIRKKLAKSVSDIQTTEDFEWRKWLKEPSLHEEKIEQFATSVINTDNQNQWLEKPSHEGEKIVLGDTIVLPELKDFSSRKTKTNLVFFGFGSPGVKKFKLVDFEARYKQKPTEIKFRNKSSTVKSVDCIIPDSIIKNHPWEIKPEVIKIDLLRPETYSIEKNKDNVINVELASISVPPKIYKDKILNLNKIKQTKIYFLKNINVKQEKQVEDFSKIFEYPEVIETDIDKLGMKQEVISINLSQTNLVEDIETETVANIINSEVTPPIEEVQVEVEVISDVNIIPEDLAPPKEEELPQENKIEEKHEEKNEEEEDDNNYVNVFESLYNYQREGAEFLLKHKRALLSDELGLGKTVEAISVLKNLFASGRIESALIVCPTDHVGSTGKIEGFVDGWIGNLQERMPEIKIVNMTGSLQERKKKWQTASGVLISTYDDFFFDIEESVSGSKELKHFNCLILDEVQIVINKKSISDKLPKLINPKYIIGLSSIRSEDIKDDWNKIFKNELSIKSYLGRSKKDVVKEIPNVVWQDKWLDMDEEQSTEYKDAFVSAKEKVSWLLESGNPLRFNANIFTILHQLKQTCNFSSNSVNSPKTQLLARQIELIAKNNKKVVVFSQYDKSGTKKIEEVLSKSNIAYVSCAPEMSTKDVESTIKNFINSKSLTAMIAGIKPGRMKITSAEIPYVIHFDQWWNPATVWQTETLFTPSRSVLLNENLNIYSYLMKGTIEEKINNLLFRKGFLNKCIMEYVNADSIAEMIANQEWLEVFGIPDKEFRSKYETAIRELTNKIESSSSAELMEKGKNFFSKLGYRNIDAFENTGKNYFDVRGIIKKVNYDLQMNARFVSNDFLSSEEIKNHLDELKEKTNNGKIFLVSKGTFEKTDLTVPNIALIDLRQLANYFYHFRVI